jgi:hypothetical protein
LVAVSPQRREKCENSRGFTRRLKVLKVIRTLLEELLRDQEPTVGTTGGDVARTPRRARRCLGANGNALERRVVERTVQIRLMVQDQVHM